MADLVCEQQRLPKKKSRVSKYPHGEPRNPWLVQEVVRMRDEKQMTWQAIGESLGMSRQGPYEVYRRWVQGIKKKRKNKDDTT